jgi:hypothetical protein
MTGRHLDKLTHSYSLLLLFCLKRSYSHSLTTFTNKAWKKFAGEVEGMTKALKKKDMSGALEIYRNSALAALDAYLAQVELPSASEI